MASPEGATDGWGKPAYDVDFHGGLVWQAQALRSRRHASLDWDNLAEEIEALAASERHKLVSHLKVLLAHLLKWSW